VKKFVIGVFVCALVSACGSSPTAPENFAQIGGNWTGTFDSSNWNPIAVKVNLTQSAGSVTGTWAGPTDWNGTVDGNVDKDNFTGTFTFSGPRSGGGRCSATGSFSGPARTGASTLKWTSPGFSGDCTGLPLSVALNIQR